MHPRVNYASVLLGMASLPPALLAQNTSAQQPQAVRKTRPRKPSLQDQIVQLQTELREHDAKLQEEIDNKLLSHALSLVKAQQELKREVKVLTNSERDGYKKRPRQVYGPNFIEKPPAPKTVEMTV